MEVGRACFGFHYHKHSINKSQLALSSSCLRINFHFYKIPITEQYPKKDYNKPYNIIVDRKNFSRRRSKFTIKYIN